MSSRSSGQASMIVMLAAFAGCSPAPAPKPASISQPAAIAVPAPADTPAKPPSVDASRNDVDVAPAIVDADIPPLPVTPFPFARPKEIVQAVYTFAARHPEVLSKVPCFCGCETRGHRHNDDCFVAARDTRGRPTAWEPHGVG